MDFTKVTELTVKLTLIEEALGMMPADKDIYANYIASNSPDAETLTEELESISEEEALDNRRTIFPKLSDGTPFVWDYQLKGFFKDTIGMLKRVTGSECSKLTAFKKLVDGLVFIKDRKNPYTLSGQIGDCQRPLRAQTAQGDRVALAASETVPAGSTLEFTIQLFDKKLEPAIRECLDYGRFRGLGQWRNSGKGRYEWKEIK